MITGLIIKALLKSKIFKVSKKFTVMAWCLGPPFEYDFPDETQKPSFSWTAQIFRFEEM